VFQDLSVERMPKRSPENYIGQNTIWGVIIIKFCNNQIAKFTFIFHVTRINQFVGYFSWSGKCKKISAVFVVFVSDVNIGSLYRGAGSGRMERPGITPTGLRANRRTGFWRTAWGAGTSGMMSPVLNPTMPLYAKYNVT
jgi:hypothetical protein